MVFRVVQELPRAPRLVLRLRRRALLRPHPPAIARAAVAAGFAGHTVGPPDPWQAAPTATICRSYVALLRSSCEAADDGNAAGPWLGVCRSAPAWLHSRRLSLRSSSACRSGA